MKTWEPGAKAEWALLGIVVCGIALAGLLYHYHLPILGFFRAFPEALAALCIVAYLAGAVLIVAHAVRRRES